MAYIDGDDFINGAILSFQEGNRIKNNWRGAVSPANIQPGMIFSDSDDDKLYHAGAGSAQEEVLQLSRSQDVSPTFLYETLLGRNLKTWWNFEDFINAPYDSAFRNGIWGAVVSGANAQVRDWKGSILRPGNLLIYTGATAGGTAAIYLGPNIQSPFLFGGGSYIIEGDILIDSLSDVTETYALRFGFGDNTFGDHTDGAYFEYSNAGATPNWYRCTASNGIRTKNDTTIAAVTGVWIRVKVVVNADGTSVEFFINGVSVGSNIANIPIGAGRETSAIYSIVKSAGTTGRIAFIDWVWIHINLTTSR